MSQPVPRPFPLDAIARDGNLQAQLYARVRAAIAEGRLAPGQRMPSARSLAGQLGVARGTVDAAYARLAGEGFVLGRGPAGTIVAPGLRAGSCSAPDVPSIPVRTEAPLPFRGGLPALDLFPRGLWARLAARAARQLHGAALGYPDPAGLPALRHAIAGYLAVSRGIVCGPEQVVVTSGYQDALALVARLLLRPGDRVWLEDPGYPLTRQALAGVAEIVPVPVDEAGMQVETARARHPSARLAIVTPAHQSPLGVALSLPRRQDLLDWAADQDAWVLEDDYDSEFRYVGHRLPALKSIDRADRVLCAGSFSKTLFPALRLGYLVVPARLVAAATEAARLLHHGQAVLEQMTTAAFLADGHFARHLRRMRSLYAARRAALVEALAREFGPAITLEVRSGGLHVLACFPDRPRDTVLAHRAWARGLGPGALSDFSVTHDAGSALLLGFTNIAESQAPAMAAALRRAIDTADD